MKFYKYAVVKSGIILDRINAYVEAMHTFNEAVSKAIKVWGDNVDYYAFEGSPPSAFRFRSPPDARSTYYQPKGWRKPGRDGVTTPVKANKEALEVIASLPAMPGMYPIYEGFPDSINYTAKT